MPQGWDLGVLWVKNLSVGICDVCDSKRLSRGYNSIVVIMLTVHMDVSTLRILLSLSKDLLAGRFSFFLSTLKKLYLDD